MKTVWQWLGAGIMCCVIAFGAALLASTLTARKMDRALDIRSAQSNYPGMDAVDSYRCPRHLIKTVHLRGVEDGYNRANSEPFYLPEPLHNIPTFATLLSGGTGAIGLRDYDEGGSDKFLFDAVQLPAGTVDGMLIARISSRSDGENDGVSLALLQDFFSGKTAFPGQTGYSIGISTMQTQRLNNDGSDKIVSAPLSAFKYGMAGKPYHKATESFGDPDFDGQLLIQWSDDHQIDFQALISCSKPGINMGTTISEIRSTVLPENLSYLSCAHDRGAPMCDAHRGDLDCREEIPLACVLPGNGSGQDLPPVMVSRLSNFTPNEIRLTSPVAGNSFENRDAVNQMCRDIFGQQARVLRYHETGGGAILSWSTIPDLSRMWIDVHSSSTANCWDAPNPASNGDQSNAN